MKRKLFDLRPAVANPGNWYPDRSNKYAWEKKHKTILDRDDYTCISCGHRSLKRMEVHHLHEFENDNLQDDEGALITLCTACHAIQHFGQSMMYRSIEVWQSGISQVEIVRATREGVRRGKTLAEINATFDLKKGKYAPDSLEWANQLAKTIEMEPTAELAKPLCAVFVLFKSWQLEN